MSEYPLCVSLGNIDSSRVKEAVGKYDFIEFRLDLLDRNERLFELVSYPKKSILTFHKSPSVASFYERSDALIKGIESGGLLIDLDYEDEMIDVEEKAKKHFTKLIRSYHNYTETPSEIELEKIIFQAKRSADFVKIATKVRTYDDALLLLNLLKIHKDLIVVGMGEIGSLVRILAPKLGSPWTYASLDTNLETAPGQIPVDTLSRFQELLEIGEMK